MSVDNIKELFNKRISDAHNLNSNVEESKTETHGIHSEESIVKHVFESLTEKSAGITEYLNKNNGFSAVIKERFSDFQVHEIDLDGNAVHLTNFEIPVVAVPSCDISEDIIDETVWEQLKSLEEKKIQLVEIDVSEFDKEKRRKIHKVIKGKYRQLFTTNTTTSGTDSEKKLITVSLNKDPRSSWNQEHGKYLHFVLFKVNMDTMDAINLIANKINIKVANFSYAGTKDKRGKTSQQVSIWHLGAERLNSINKFLRNVKVGNFSYKNKELKLGDLKGNHFKIALRNVTADDQTVDQALKSLEQNGFINYFGLQRFGNCPEIPTFRIGKSLIKGDFKTAVELILKPRDQKAGKDGLEEARKVWWDTRDAKKAYKCLRSRDRTYEGKLLLGLSTHGSKAYVNALDSLPRNVRLLYLHSYQSLLWNKIVSKRIHEYGSQVLVGDLIWTKDDEVELGDTDGDSESETGKSKPLVRCITEEEVKNYKITDIVHPLPGYNVMYPNNIIKTWYEDLLKEEGLTSEEFRQSVKKYSLSGTYRNIVKNVKDLSWSIMYYSKPEDDLILSDIDIIEKKEIVSNCESGDGFKAVLVNFILDSSTYATMAIREVLKINTSSSYQASLNNYSNKRKTEAEEDVANKKIKT